MTEPPPIHAVPDRRRRIPPLRKGVYILPSLFTSAGLFSGFYSIIATLGTAALAACLTLVRPALSRQEAEGIQAPGGSRDTGERSQSTS